MTDTATIAGTDAIHRELASAATGLHLLGYASGWRLTSVDYDHADVYGVDQGTDSIVKETRMTVRAIDARPDHILAFDAVCTGVACRIDHVYYRK